MSHGQGLCTVESPSTHQAGTEFSLSHRRRRHLMLRSAIHCYPPPAAMPSAWLAVGHMISRGAAWRRRQQQLAWHFAAPSKKGRRQAPRCPALLHRTSQAASPVGSAPSASSPAAQQQACGPVRTPMGGQAARKGGAPSLPAPRRLVQPWPAAAKAAAPYSGRGPPTGSRRPRLPPSPGRRS
jgi:hypothetical protein